MRKKRGCFKALPVAEWKRRIRALKASGLSQEEFCRREGISRVALNRWRRQIEGASRRPGAGRGGRKATPCRKRLPFAEVRIRPEGAVAEAKSSPSGMTIVLSSGDRLLLSDATCDPDWLGRVIRALRSGPC